MARRQSRRRIRRAQGARWRRSRGRGIRRTAEWNRHLATAGLTCLGWPEEHGGRGLSVAHRVAFTRSTPRRTPRQGEPLRRGAARPDADRVRNAGAAKRFLPDILDVTELWCQGYSEPGAGSDLANVSTTAELGRPGERTTATQHWVINGQKVWTSMAHLSQWCFVVARTEKGSKRHVGLSYLLVPLRLTRASTIRPDRAADGTADFNEVFFDDARTEASLVVGEPGDGWRVAMGTLDVRARRLDPGPADPLRA